MNKTRYFQSTSKKWLRRTKCFRASSKTQRWLWFMRRTHSLKSLQSFKICSNRSLNPKETRLNSAKFKKKQVNSSTTQQTSKWKYRIRSTKFNKVCLRLMPTKAMMRNITIWTISKDMLRRSRANHRFLKFRIDMKLTMTIKTLIKMMRSLKRRAAMIHLLKKTRAITTLMQTNRIPRKWSATLKSLLWKAENLWCKKLKQWGSITTSRELKWRR